MKALYCGLGWLFFTIGLVGVLLPVLPTTVFMILALWMFSRGSDRFHHWLYRHRVFGPSLQLWQQYRIIPVKAKIAAVTMMSLSLGYLLLTTRIAWWSYALIGALMLYGAWYVLSKPSSIPAETETETETA